MKTFRIYCSGQNIREQRPVFIEEGFSFMAMIFSFFWFLYHALLLEAITFLISQFALTLVSDFIGYKIYLALQIIVYLAIGVFAGQIRIMSLERSGYKFTDIIVAKNHEEARLNFFKNYLSKDDGN